MATGKEQRPSYDFCPDGGNVDYCQMCFEVRMKDADATHRAKLRVHGLLD